MFHSIRHHFHRTLDVLLDHLQDLDLLTILARTADRSEP